MIKTKKDDTILNTNRSCLNCSINCIQQYNLHSSQFFIEKANNCKDYTEDNDNIRSF